MPFDWSSRSNDNLLERFPLGTVGLEAWHALVGRITVSDLSEAGYLSAFDAFLAAASQEHQNYRAQANKPQCQVFVSHQRLDVERAKRVAYLATQHNLDYWLDVHDPQLSQVPHGSGVGPCSQLRQRARIRALVVLPHPRGPEKR